MSKKKPPAEKSKLTPINASAAICPNERAEFACRSFDCQAEFSLTNEPGKPDSYPVRVALFCPFCGDDNLQRV